MIEITFQFLEEEGYESVNDFCRYLVSTGGDFEGSKLHVYRGDMLCLIVSDIPAAAKIQPTGTGWETYRSKSDRHASRIAAKPRGEV
mgnify:CR=1 FL=1